MECLVEYFTDGLLNGMVDWKSIGVHVVERGHTCECCIEKQNEKVTRLTVEENDGHYFEDNSQAVLDEA